MASRVRASEPLAGRGAAPISLITSAGRARTWDDADVLAVGVASSGGTASSGRAAEPDATARLAAERYGVDLRAVLAQERVSGRSGEVVRVPVAAPPDLPARWLLVGTGAGTTQDARRAGAALARAVRGRTQVVTSLGDGLSPEAVSALVEGLVLGGWAPPATGITRRAQERAAAAITMVGAVPPDRVAAGVLHAGATVRARDLAARPSNRKSPEWLADEAVRIAGESGLTVRVWDEKALADDGFGGLLAVGAGSSTPPRFVRLDYEPDGTGGRGRRAGAGAASRSASRVVLVGKGITYDTGGLSIKPREAMVPMKTDMAGAAAVLATLAACRDAGVRRPVTGLLAIAENAFGASSYRPSDVVRHFGGRTVEVTNTDAEGRMVLADALAYADATLDPETIIDVATLTGAATLALGRRHAALFATDDRLARSLVTAGARAGESLWRLPLVEEYRTELDSSVADLRHVAAGSVGAGAVVAALFLREFTGGRRWAHLDIAGAARSDKDDADITRGPTGFGARLLLRWLSGLR